MGKTKYFYKGKEISHLDFLRLMRELGLVSGYRVSHWDHLVEMAEKGNEKAISLLADMERKFYPVQEFPRFFPDLH